MNLYQEENDGIVSLTDAGVKEIQAHKNFYSDATKPIPREKRDWHMKDMANLWIGIIVSVAVYQVASGLLVAGMTWYEALLTIVLGHTLVMAVAMIIGHYGVKYGMNYAMLGKAIFGQNGLCVPAIIRGILGIFWFGVQAWIGGQATSIIISTVFPAWGDLGFPGLFISFLIFWALNVYIAASGNKAVKILEGISAPALIAMSLIVIVWGLSTAGWSLDTLLSAQVVQARGDTDFWTLFWPALSAMIAFDGGIALSMPDFTRSCVNQKAQIVGQIISAPVMTGYIAFVGICGTAGAWLAFGKEIWEPAVLVGCFPSPIIRLIFSLFIIMAILTTNVAGNLIPPVNIVASYVKGRFSYRKVAIFVAFLSLFAQPWNSLSSAYHLIFDVTQLLGALIGPISGIYIAAYLFEYHTDLSIVDAYIEGPGKYFYSNGWNIRAIVIMLIFTAIIFAGKWVPALSPLFNNAYVFGTLGACITYALVCKLGGNSSCNTSSKTE